jgi:hypothetical protein
MIVLDVTEYYFNIKTKANLMKIFFQLFFLFISAAEDSYFDKKKSLGKYGTAQCTYSTEFSRFFACQN